MSRHESADHVPLFVSFAILDQYFYPMPVLPLLFFTILLDAIGVGMILPVIPTLLTDPTSPSFLLGSASSAIQYAVAGLLTASFGLFLLLLLQ